MTDRKDIDLVVRAQIQGAKDLNGVAKSIAEIGASIEDQSKAAKRGESTIDELKASLESLAQIQRTLQGQNSAVRYFERLGEGIKSAESRVQRATERYDAYNKKLQESEKVTEKQQDTLARYARAVDAANKSLTAQQDIYGKISAEFREAGIALDQLTSLQQRNLNLQAELGLVTRRGADAIRDYAKDVRAAREAQAQLDRQNAQSARDAELFERAQRRAAEALEARARAAREVDDARSARAGEVAANRRADDEVRAAAAEAQRLAQRRKDVEAAFADDTFRREADNAAAAARGYTTLARAADTLVPKTQSLRDAVSAITNPSATARNNLAGLEEQVSEFATSISRIRGPVQDYREQITQLAAAQKAAATQAGLVDAYNRQVQALREARATFVQARSEVAQYAAQVRLGGDGAAEFAQKLAQAEQRLRGSAQGLAQRVQATRQVRESLRSAGIETGNLVQAQQRLTAVAQSTVNSVRALDAAVEKYGTSAGKVGSTGGFFGGDGGRTTLSFLQRIRGEVLSLAAAYTGLFAVINTAQGAINQTREREGIRNQLGISVGNDRAAIDAEYEYVKAQSERIGIEFDVAARNFAKFSAAATLAGRDRQEVRSIFETFSEVSRVANLSADDLDGVFRALTQITSKGKIQAEELRGQLGDRLFGAFEIAAKALQDQFPDLDKALKNGEVSAAQLVKIAEQYRKTVADQLPAATNGLAASQARLNNAVGEFQLAVADSGFIDSYREALIAVTDFLRSEDGRAAAQVFGAVFKAIADAVVLVLANINELTTALKIFAGIFVLQRFASGISALGDIKKLTVDLAGGFADVGKELSKTQKFLGAIGALFIGLQIGTYLYEEFQIVRDAGTYLFTNFLKVIAVIKASYEAAFAAFPVFAREVFEKIVDTIKRAARGLTGIFAGLAEAVGLDGVGQALRKVERSVETSFSGFGKASAVVSTFRENLKKELAQIDSIRNDMLEGNDRTAVPGRPRAGTPTPNPTGTGRPTATPPSEAEIAKRQREIESITTALENLDARIDRAQTETLQKQLDAIETSYQDLARRIERLGGKEAAAFTKRLADLTGELRTVTIKKFNDALFKEQQALANKVIDLEEKSNRKAELDLDRRLSAISSNYAQFYTELEQQAAKVSANGLDTSALTALKDRARISEEFALNQERVKFQTEELNRREQAVNDVIAARDKLLAAVNTQKEVGNISDVEAATQLNALQAEYVPKIQAAAAAAREFALANAQVFQNEEQQRIFLATLDAITAKAVAVKTEFSNIENAIIKGGVNAVNQGLNLVADSLQGLFDGTKNLGDGFRGLIAGFGQFAASFLRDIALMIIRQQIFNALVRSGNPILAAVGAAGGGVLHSGGIVGGVQNRTRNVSPSWFAGAPRYHRGGLPGLAADEYPAILQKGEEVLAADSPRNILNGGGMMGGTAAPGNFRMVLVDDRSKVPEAMNSPEGEQVFTQYIRRNAATIKQILK